MCRVWLIALCFFLSIPAMADTEPVDLSAERMLSACRDVAAARITDGGIVMPKDFDSGLCWGAFGVLQTVISIVHVNEEDKTYSRVLGVCVPSDATRSQLIAIFVEFAKRNPQRYHEDFYFVTKDALKAAFPCSKP